MYYAIGPTGKVHSQREIAYGTRKFPKPALCGYQASPGSWKPATQAAHQLENPCKRCIQLLSEGSL
jgi:hypothetical protein